MFESKIKELRIKKNFTQDEMADTLHISQNAYSLIENGKTRLIDTDRIKLIAEKLQVEPMELGVFDGMGITVNYNEKVDNSYTSHIQTIHKENKELISILKEQLAMKDKQIEQLLQNRADK